MPRPLLKSEFNKSAICIWHSKVKPVHICIENCIGDLIFKSLWKWRMCHIYFVSQPEVWLIWIKCILEKDIVLWLNRNFQHKRQIGRKGKIRNSGQRESDSFDRGQIEVVRTGYLKSFCGKRQVLQSCHVVLIWFLWHEESNNKGDWKL